MGVVSATPYEGGLKEVKLPCLTSEGRGLGITIVIRIIKGTYLENLPNSYLLAILC